MTTGANRRPSDHRFDHLFFSGMAAVAALENDPFYRSICGPSAADTVRRRAILTRYFAYSIQEGRDIGRCVHLADRTRGVAVWVLPQAPDVQSRAAHEKRVFLQTTLDAEGCANYYRIVNFMKVKTASVFNDSGWYLSIVAVDPHFRVRGSARNSWSRRLPKLIAPSRLVTWRRSPHATFLFTSASALLSRHDSRSRPLARTTL